MIPFFEIQVKMHGLWTNDIGNSPNQFASRKEATSEIARLDAAGWGRPMVFKTRVRVAGVMFEENEGPTCASCRADIKAGQPARQLSRQGDPNGVLYEHIHCPQDCGYCGADAGDDWETVDDEHQEAICQACKKAGAHLQQAR